MTEPACGVFSDLAGKLIAIAFTLFAFLTYVVSFAIRRGRTDFRSWRVFWLDLSKMGLGQVAAYAINIVNTSRNAKTHDFDEISWYFPTFLNDELIAVPLGVLLWHTMLAAARRLSRRYPRVQWLQALQASGRYHPDPADTSHLSNDVSHLSAPLTDSCHDCPRPSSPLPASCDARDARWTPTAAPCRPGAPPPPLLASKAACGCAGAAARATCGCCCWPCTPADHAEASLVRYDWWMVQLLFWVGAVLASRELGGAGIPIISGVMGPSSPYDRLAQAIDDLHWSCSAKRWTFAGIFRILLDLAQLFFVDSLNKFRRGKAGASGGRAAV